MFAVAKRVAAGAALLDQEEPGWDARVDPETLDMSTDEDCVLGQLFGEFGTGADKLDLTDKEVESFGFFRQGGKFFARLFGEYEKLTDAWRTLIRGRQFA